MKGLSIWLDLVTWTVVVTDALLPGRCLGLRRSSGCVSGLRPHRRANPCGRFLSGWSGGHNPFRGLVCEVVVLAVVLGNVLGKGHGVVLVVAPGVVVLLVLPIPVVL